MFKDWLELIFFVLCIIKYMLKLVFGKIEFLLIRISFLFFFYYNLFLRFGINICVWKNCIVDI